MGNAKAPSKARAAPTSSTVQSLSVDGESAQRLLNLFSAAFAPILASDSLPALLQDIKQALFRRDFAAAFSRPDLLQAYAARWSPTRAVCYAAVLRDIAAHLDGTAADAVIEQPQYHGPNKLRGKYGQTRTTESTERDQHREYDSPHCNSNQNQELPGLAGSYTPRKRLRMLAIGGCAAEIVAYGSHLRDFSLDGSLVLLDVAPWTPITSLLYTTIVSPLPLSKYASAAARAANEPFLSPNSRLSLSFSQTDVLSLSRHDLASITTTQPLLVTLLFTLNELYTIGGIAQTTKFLGMLSDVLASGSLLLVVDSPGSYSEAKVGKADKRYPMQWLLHHTLLVTKAESYIWERLESHDSMWCRLSTELSYPVQLEDMRYQMHLYRIRKT